MRVIVKCGFWVRIFIFVRGVASRLLFIGPVSACGGQPVICFDFIILYQKNGICARAEGNVSRHMADSMIQQIGWVHTKNGNGDKKEAAEFF